MNNPRGLAFGSRILASRTCSVVYVEDKKTIVYCEEQYTGRVIGLVKKALGTYYSGSKGDYFSLEDYEEPRLIVSKYVWLYVVKDDFDAPQFLVHPDDIL